jgi:hypothetical protein
MQTLTEVRKADNRAKVAGVAKVVWQMTTGAILLAVISFIAWAVMNSDVLWKAMRYPEAVRQMQIEVIIKK